MFALTIRSDRMENKDYEIEAEQPLLGKYVVLLLKGGEVVRKFSSYSKRDIYKRIQKLAESKNPEGSLSRPGLQEEDKVHTL